MEKGLVVCDTNVFIEFYKNNPEVVGKLQKIGSDNIALSFFLHATSEQNFLSARKYPNYTKSNNHLTERQSGVLKNRFKFQVNLIYAATFK